MRQYTPLRRFNANILQRTKRNICDQEFSLSILRGKIATVADAPATQHSGAFGEMPFFTELTAAPHQKPSQLRALQQSPYPLAKERQ